MSWCEERSLVLVLFAIVCLGKASPVVGGNAIQEIPPMESHEKPRIVHMAASAAEIPLYGMCELTIDMRATYDNPFDPEQVDLTAEFVAPSGKRVTVPGFFYQPYTNRNEGDDAKRPLLDANGPPCWRVRFAPVETGKHTYVVRLRNHFDEAQGDLKSEPGSFVATASETPGFIRVSKKDGRYFQFDNGAPFFAIGQNLQDDWPVYKHSRLLAEGGGNCARVWTFCHWTWLEWTLNGGGFEWAGPGDWMRSYAGAGRYNQRIAWIADHHLEQWACDGIFVMLCMGNGTDGGELSASKEAQYDSWGGHPYNVANGGFLDAPAKFWTDERTKKLYKQRLRYIVARWGYSRSIWAWEFWNELGEATPEIVAWHKEMAQYLHDIDSNRHLITTSTWGGNADKFAAMWDLKEIDFTQSHHYGPLTAMMPRIAQHLARWPNPHIVGEGGGPEPEIEAGQAPGENIALDPDGIEFHNLLWAPAMSGAAGTTLSWWWRQRIEPRNLFYHYRAVADFVRDVPWDDARFRPIRVRAISLTGSGAAALLAGVDRAVWGRLGQQAEAKPVPRRGRRHRDRHRATCGGAVRQRPRARRMAQPADLRGELPQAGPVHFARQPCFAQCPGDSARRQTGRA